MGGAPIQITFTVGNTGPYPVYEVRLTVTVAAGLAGTPPPLDLGKLAGGDSVSTTVSLPIVAAGTDQVEAQVVGIFREETLSSATVQVGIVIHQPVLRVNPAVGPPGLVVAATGANFPPGAVVTLAWDRGVPATMAATVAPDGTVQLQVLVFHHDLLGERLLTASSGAGLFGPVQAPFLVVAANQEPLGFVERR
ncbi:MAG: hypothetical protein JXA67_11670 [Micromonosporaceae bacterium]|nr:hypothetical protein [Micromonosporaceae bacterium]